jgi:DNA-binding MarR family transcriptional regulator
MLHHHYFDTLAAVRRVEKKHQLDQLDLPARAILEFIGIAEAERRVLNVGDIVKQSSVGTPPTVYKYLADLEQAGWIKVRTCIGDRRQKLVRLSAAAQRAFSRMGEVLQ